MDSIFHICLKYWSITKPYLKRNFQIYKRSKKRNIMGYRQLDKNKMENRHIIWKILCKHIDDLMQTLKHRTGEIYKDTKLK